MAFQRWMERRRIKELEKVNQELEQLKSNPLARRAEKSSSSKIAVEKTTNHTSAAGKSLLVILGFLFLIGLAIYYRGKAADLKDEQQKVLGELDTMKTDLADVSEALDERESQLRVRQMKEQNLSTQHRLLEDTISALDKKIAQLENDLSTKDSQIYNLTADLRHRDERIENLTRCIDDNDITDKEDCIDE